MIRLFFLLILFLILSSCKKEKVIETINPPVIPPIVQNLAPDFPNSIGDNWKYKWSHSSLVDTVQVEIVGQGILPNGDSAKIWKYTFQTATQTIIDTTWVTHIGNIVRIFSNPCWICTDPMPYERFRYEMPLIIGNYWDSDSLCGTGDTTKILNSATIIVPVDTFENVFQLARTQSFLFNSFKLDTIYFKEHIGLLKMRQFEYNLSDVLGNGLWELTSYHVQ
jgi:hypothetical protein